MAKAKYKSLGAVQAAMKAGSTNCVSLVQYYLHQIEAQKSLNAYIEVYAEEALAKAEALDKKYSSAPSSIGQLHGMVLSIKDVLCYKDHGVTAASKILEDFESIFTATAIERLLAEDAIIIGRVNCDQFAMGSTNENSIYGPTLNPIDQALIPGGSSGASAVSVSADTCLASLGTDTGGSVRQPAAFCDVIGMKPSYGRVSRFGLLAYASSFDQIGTLTHSVEDAALLMSIMAGEDSNDATSSKAPVPAYAKQLQFEGKAKIAYFDAALDSEGIHPEIKAQTLQVIQKIKADGHQVEAVPFDLLEYIIPAYYVLTTAEASSNLSRYDGVRFGHRSTEATSLEEIYLKSRTEGFSEEVKRRIMLGTFVLSSGYYDAYYTKAQKIRRLIQQRTFEIFEKYDFILMPASPVPPWKVGEKIDDPVSMYLADIFTVQANMAGIPAVSLPLAQHNDGLPIGIQFMAKPFAEAQLLAFSKHLMDLF